MSTRSLPPLRYLSFEGQPPEEGLNHRAAQLGRVADAMKANERTAPVDVGLFGTAAVAQHADALPKLTKQLRRARRRHGRRARWGRNAARDAGSAPIDMHSLPERGVV